MYLKKIETQGFKSFADRTVLNFEQGLMGIVGPNGSGKSNVADAVRWVLGEQSPKQLRSARMQDVIFAGTQTRRPQGFAYVELTIDNQDHCLAVDYDEVTVMRRVYRSGESEYALNGRSCRLRDIQELFYDTGVGQEGYSFIGQGQIDAILSGRPEERRELFDEAAGIMRFKRRRESTRRKLETEEGNLASVTVLRDELTRQEEPLEREAQKAEEYLKCREKLRQMDLASYCLESADDRRKAEEAQGALARAQEERENCAREREELQTRLGTARKRQKEAEEALERTRQERTEKQVSCEKWEGSQRFLEEQIRQAQSDGEKSRNRLAELDREKAQKERQRADLKREQESLHREQEEKSRETKRLQDARTACEERIRRRESEREEEEKRQRTLLEEKAELAASLTECETRLKQVRERRGELERAETAARRQTEKRAEQRNSLEKALSERSAGEESLKAAGKRNAAVLEELQSGLREKNQRQEHLSQRYQNLQSRRDSLKNLAERYEGYGSSVRRMMEKRKQIPGIRGVVADLFHTDPQYETAIETALGGRIRNIVTDTEQTARTCIDYLKKNHLGRATFLPRESVRGRGQFPRPEALRERGALGVASELVETGEEYRPIADYLLGRFLVVDTIDSALSIAAHFHYTLNIVTLEGELLSPGGAMTGGSYRNSSNLLGRRREIAELEKKAEAVRLQRDSCRQEIAALEKKREQTRQEGEELREDRHRAELEKNTLTLELNRCLSETKKDGEERKAREEERERLAGEQEERVREREKLRARQEELTASLEKPERTDRTEEGNVPDLQGQLARLNEELAKAGQDAVTLGQRKTFQEENLRRLEKETASLRSERETLEETLSESGKRGARQREEREACRQKIEEEKRALANLTRQEEEQTKERDIQRARLEELEGERENQREQMEAFDREILRLQTTGERIREQMDARAADLWNEYEVTPTEAEKEGVPEGLSRARCRQRAQELRRQMRDLGPVNVGAIEEYRTVSERAQFVRGQYDDLVKAAESLRKIVRELETGMRQQFSEQFARIQEEFGKTFRELFGGGKGWLSLEESEDILEADIVIHAQPPGKKLRDVRQLSGGERTLTAIALLFAIQNLKPSPFCLLDEIDAALDEPNVGRFADYLDHLKEHTQFLVITHRRGTMERAGKLYGVTMQEKGVSTLISVELTDAALDDLTKER